MDTIFPKIPLKKRVWEWVVRYGPLDCCAATTSYLAYFYAHGATGSEVWSAFASAWGENIGFYGYLLIRETLADMATAKRRLYDYNGKERWRTLKNVFSEFGIAEIFDSLFIRPVCIGCVVHYIGPIFGIYLGGQLADFAFYLPAIFSFEYRKEKSKKDLVTRCGSRRCACEFEWDDRLKAIQACDLFSLLSSDDLQFITGLFEKKDYEDGNVICRQGDDADEFFIVMKGAVDVLRAGSPKPLAQFNHGSIAGDYAFFLGNKRTANLVARGETKLLSLSYEKFRRFLLAFPEATITLLKSQIHQNRLLHSSTATS